MAAEPTINRSFKGLLTIGLVTTLIACGGSSSGSTYNAEEIEIEEEDD